MASEEATYSRREGEKGVVTKGNPGANRCPTAEYEMANSNSHF